MQKMNNMKSAMKKITACCLFSTILLLSNSCKKFSTVNTNPNSITAASSSPDYIMAGVLTGTATWYGNLGSGDISGAMQHTYEDAFGSTFSDYEWDPGDFDWTSTYQRLTNNKLLLSQAQSNKWDFHQGVALVMRAFNYGNIADFWGDAPDSMAISADQGGAYNFPTFDSQESIYQRVIADLKAAIPYFSGSMADHPEITSVTQSSDVFYSGDPNKRRRFPYSLLLRYSLRLSAKMDEQANVESVADSVFQSTADDCAMAFPGKDAASSYQFAQIYTSASEFQRNKMCGTMTMTLKALQDPRIVIMAQPIVTPSVVDASAFAPGDTSLTLLSNGVRYINPAAAANDNYKQFNLATY